jgi:hypothetical protein
MKMWITRNLRFGLWIHAGFLLIFDLSFGRAFLSSVANDLLLTAFLPHLAVVMTFASSDYPENEMLARSLFALIVCFPLSLLYASALRWLGRFALSLRRRKALMGHTNV